MLLVSVLTWAISPYLTDGGSDVRQFGTSPIELLMLIGMVPCRADIELPSWAHVGEVEIAKSSVVKLSYGHVGEAHFHNQSALAADNIVANRIGWEAEPNFVASWLFWIGNVCIISYYQWQALEKADKTTRDALVASSRAWIAPSS
jgi:hypothetical protein